MNILSKYALSCTPYVAGEQLNDREYVKLNTNENPYAPSPLVAKALSELDISRLRLYPKPNSDGLREAIAKAEGVKKENVFCGNGSDEVLALCFPTFFDRDGDGVCFADITYSFYPVFCSFFSIPEKTVALEEDFSLSLEKMARVNAQGYIICNPNAPTSIGIPKDEIEKFINLVNGKTVILDEAYMGFYSQSAVELTKKYKNVLVVKTFSKAYSLAGIRSGYAIGDEELIEGLFKIKDSFNSYPLDMVCQSVCAAAISDKEYYDKVISDVVSERERTRNELAALGFKSPESSSNFIFADCGKWGGKYMYESLKKKGVLVRYFDKGRLKSYLRITIGTKEQNNALIKAIGEITHE